MPELVEENVTDLNSVPELVGETVLLVTEFVSETVPVDVRPWTSATYKRMSNAVVMKDVVRGLLVIVLEPCNVTSSFSSKKNKDTFLSKATFGLALSSDAAPSTITF